MDNTNKLGSMLRPMALVLGAVIITIASKASADHTRQVFNVVEIDYWDTAEVARQIDWAESATAVAHYLASSYSKDYLIAGSHSIKTFLGLNKFRDEYCHSGELERRRRICQSAKFMLKQYCLKCIEKFQQHCRKVIMENYKRLPSYEILSRFASSVDMFVRENNGLSFFGGWSRFIYYTMKKKKAGEERRLFLSEMISNCEHFEEEFEKERIFFDFGKKDKWMDSIANEIFSSPVMEYCDSAREFDKRRIDSE